MPQPASLPPQNDEVDVPRLALPLRRHVLPLLSAALLAGGITYAATAAQARQYETMSSVVTLGGNEDGDVERGLFAAPPLPPGTLQQALRDGQVVDDIARRVGASGLPADQARALTGAVEGQRRGDTFSLVTVSTPKDSSSNLYEVRGRASSPASAQALVNASVDALIAWDQGRARERLAQARTSLQRQLAELNRNEPPLNASDLRWNTFQSAQAQLTGSLQRVSLLEQAAAPTLQVVARAPQPLAPVAVSPLSRAALAALLALFGASAVILLLEAWRRRVYDGHSLRDLGVPLLGQLPRLGVTGPAPAALDAVRAGPLGDSLGFLRVNVLSQLTPGEPRRLVFSSPRDGGGTGSVVTALAASLAEAGERVLIVDAGVGALPSSGEAGAASVQRVAEGIDLLPLPGADLGGARTLVERHAAGHDVTLIATPPLLRRSDALLWGAGAAGIVLVLDPGTSSVGEVEQVMRSADLAKVRVLGVVLNELRLEGEHSRGVAGTPRASAERGLQTAP